MCECVCIGRLPRPSSVWLSAGMQDTDHRPYCYCTHTHVLGPTHSYIPICPHESLTQHTPIIEWMCQIQSLSERFDWEEVQPLERTLEELLASPFCCTLLSENNCELSSPFCVIFSHWNVISVFTKSKMPFLNGPPCAKGSVTVPIYCKLISAIKNMDYCVFFTSNFTTRRAIL